MLLCHLNTTISRLEQKRQIRHESKHNPANLTRQRSEQSTIVTFKAGRVFIFCMDCNNCFTMFIYIHKSQKKSSYIDGYYLLMCTLLLHILICYIVCFVVIF